MPNLKYSGSKGVVQSTGDGQFHISGMGITHDVDTIANVDAAKSTPGHGVTVLTTVSGGAALKVTVQNPGNVADAAGQQKFVILKGVANVGSQVQLVTEADAAITANLTAADDYALLVWTGTTWVSVAEITS